jgi:radical SAM superfamily enzyme YgiQ (UPF0313 family)
MWIKLISPGMSMRPMDSAFKTHLAPPLALLVLGALTPPEHRVTIEDENVERLNLADRPDLVGITVKVDTACRSWEIARSYRRRGVPVVLGGIHVTACPEENLPHCDALVVGEAEGVWDQVLRDAAAGQLNRVYRSAEPADLRESPIPRWELAAGKNYLYSNTITISRGCPWQCDFCYSSAANFPRGYRLKPISHILKEIASLGTRHVMFIDDNFFGDPARTPDLLAALAPLGLTWHCAVSADIGGHEDVLDLMAATGCKSLFIGFETINDGNLASCRKRQNRVADYGRTIARIHERGMMVNASLAFGFDGDRCDVFERTLEWFMARKIESMTAHILTPYPGTRLYQRLLAEGRIIDADLRNYNTARVVFRPRGMSPETLQAGYLWMYEQFYSWAAILKRLPADPRRRTAYLLFNLLYRKYGPAISLLGRLGLMGAIGRLARRLAYPPGLGLPIARGATLAASPSLTPGQ